MLVNIQSDSQEPRCQHVPPQERALQHRSRPTVSTPGARLSARARNLETASLFETAVLPVCISDDIFPLDTQSAAARVREGPSHGRLHVCAVSNGGF